MNCYQHVNCKCSKLPIYTMHQFLRLHTIHMVQMVHTVQNLVHLEHLTWIASIDINSWTIWFRWNLLSPSWIEFGIHPWCTPLISAHCITIPPKTSSSSSSSSPSSSSPSSCKKQDPQNDNHANAKREGRLLCNKKDIPYKGFSFATRPPLKRFAEQKRFSSRAI